MQQKEQSTKGRKNQLHVNNKMRKAIEDMRILQNCVNYISETQSVIEKPHGSPTLLA